MSLSGQSADGNLQMVRIRNAQRVHKRYLQWHGLGRLPSSAVRGCQMAVPAPDQKHRRVHIRVQPGQEDIEKDGERESAPQAPALTATELTNSPKPGFRSLEKWGKWGKMEKNGGKWGVMGEDGEKWRKMGGNGGRWRKMEENGG